MADYCLKTESKEAFYEACEAAGLINDEGELIASTADYCIVELGTLFNQIDDETAEALDGYHVNLRANIETGLEYLAVEVDTPMVVWS